MVASHPELPPDRKITRSGRVNPIRLVPSLVAAAVLIFVLGIINGHLTALVPFFAVSAASPLIAAALAGAAVGFACVVGHSRSAPVTALAGVAGVLWFEWVSWGVWVYDIFEATHGAQADTWSVAALWGFAKLFAAEGSYTLITGTQITGWMLWAGWVTEFAFVLFTALLCAVGLWLASGVYCERCRKWAALTWESPRFTDTPRASISAKKLREGDLYDLLALAERASSSPPVIQLRVQHCPTCESLHVLTVTRTTAEKGAEGKTNLSDRALVEDLCLTAEEFRQLREGLGRKSPPPNSP